MEDGEAAVERHFPLSREALWALVSWEGIGDALPSTAMWERMVLDMAESRVGATKTLYLKDRPPIRERLDAIDEPAFTYAYSIIDPGNLPLRSYRGRLAIVEEEDGCRLHIANRFTVDGVSAAAFAAEWKAGETLVLDALTDIATK